MVWHPSDGPIFFANLNMVHGILFLTVIGHVVHTQRDSPGGSMQSGQCTFPSQYYEVRNTFQFDIACH